ncbi:MAG TPA: 5-formyltetrahydrofolate cyclo-ligase [Chromatiaceae bacterium]|jgi:5-formyltetrahydrofolate cyclo-ligase|nr:5-formyltetrahydrofolate cyclo-ligase [Chromatiaceae bacterium]HIN81750.1 5-formyltetrahydrofolate cyclo-ligase [Chromatiales bacterium]
MDSRDQLRRRARQQRQSLSPAENARLSSLACSIFCNHPWFRNSHKIAAFFPSDGEIDPLLLVERAWAMGKRCYFPVLKPGSANALWFHEYRPGDRLLTNRFGINEPDPLKRTRISPMALDIVLTPLVCFDASGTRLGMGGGYYDRSFSHLRRRNRWFKPKMIGIAFDSQKLNRIPSENWDIPLDAIVSDKQMYIAD